MEEKIDSPQRNLIQECSPPKNKPSSATEKHPSRKTHSNIDFCRLKYKEDRQDSINDLVDTFIHETRKNYSESGSEEAASSKKYNIVDSTMENAFYTFITQVARPVLWSLSTKKIIRYMETKNSASALDNVSLSMLKTIIIQTQSV